MGWSKPVKIEERVGSSPTMVNWGADIHLVYKSGTGRLWYSLYQDGKWDWNYPIEDVKDNSRPKLGIFNNYLHMVHVDKDSKMWLTRKSGRWKPKELIPNTTIGKNGELAIASIENKGNLVYVVDKSTMIHSIYDGEKWSDPVNIEQRNLDYTGPALAVFKGKLHMVFVDPINEFNYLEHMTYDGEKWSDPVRIPDQQSDNGPALAVFKGKLHMVYHSNSYASNTLFHSIYDGEKWSERLKVPDHGSNHAPALAAIEYKGQLHMIHEGKSGTDKLYHSTYTE